MTRKDELFYVLHDRLFEIKLISWLGPLIFYKSPDGLLAIKPNMLKKNKITKIYRSKNLLVLTYKIEETIFTRSVASSLPNLKKDVATGKPIASHNHAVTK